MPEQEPTKLQRLSKLYEAVQHMIARVHVSDCERCGSTIHGLDDVGAKAQALYAEAIKGLGIEPVSPEKSQ